MTTATETWQPRRDALHQKGPRRMSDEKLERASDEHVARMATRLRAGQPHAPAVKVTRWCPFKDKGGERRFFPKTVKVVQLAGMPDVRKPGGLKAQIAAEISQVSQALAQADMMSNDRPALGAGGVEIDPLAF